MTTGTAVFFDTSIAIARTVHGPGTKTHIAQRLARYDVVAISDVVRQEFKRRLLKEAQYLLNQLEKRGSYQAVMRHVIDVLPPQQGRKRTICLEVLQTVHEEATDLELTERARRYLRSLLRFALTDLEENVDHIVRDSGCGCALQPIVEKVPYRRYEFGTDHCSRAAICGIAGFLVQKKADVLRILVWLKNLPVERKSPEICKAESFLLAFSQSSDQIRTMDPCLSVGDLLIALESAGFPDFYTMNGKESQHFCRALGQSLHIRPKNNEHKDLSCIANESNWPDF